MKELDANVYVRRTGAPDAAHPRRLCATNVGRGGRPRSPGDRRRYVQSGSGPRDRAEIFLRYRKFCTRRPGKSRGVAMTLAPRKLCRALMSHTLPH